MSEREIALDTETTGFKPQEGHKLVEIGCVEMINRIPTGKVYHQYINPQRSMPEGAFNVHGLSEEFLKDYPTFDQVAQDFVEFVGAGKLVIHNAAFDMNFLNYQLMKEGYKGIPDSQVFCTLIHARKKFPGSPASLDALCKRYGVDNSARTKHGALLDAELLADMYLELMGGAQEGLGLDVVNKPSDKNDLQLEQKPVEIREARSFPPSQEELNAHKEFLEEHLPEGLWKKLENS